jgi:transcription-repair coupling factor (superfamily II helicase)
VDKVDAGPKGTVLGFRKNKFANPGKLVQMVFKQPTLLKLRPDHRLVYLRAWDDAGDRVKGIRRLLGELAKIAA